jgi:large repetitive protein
VADSTSTTITLLDASAGQSPNDASDLLVDLVRVYTIDNLRTLAVTTSASGLGVGVSPTDLTGAGAGVTSFTRTYVEGEVVTLTATQFEGPNVFQKWQLNGNDVTPFNSTTTVAMTANQTLNAVYVIDNTPRATPDTYTADEDMALTVPAPGVFANDFNPNSLPLAVVLENGPSPAQGDLTLSSNGSFVFVPAANFSGVANFTYRISHGSSNSAPVTVSINVNSVNDPATAVAQSVVTNEDTAVGITLVGTDADGGLLDYVVVNQPTKGILGGSGANRTYTPNLNANGVDSFTFTVNDGSGVSAPAIVSLMVTPVNDLPVVTARTFTMAGGMTQAIVLAGTDVDNDPLVLSVADGPINGTVTGNSPNFIYIPNPTFTGADSFTYVANDGFANSLPANVSVTVSGILINGSFENPLAGNWAVTGTAFDITTQNFPTNGTQLARFNSGNVSPNASISQSIATRPGFRYSLLFQLGVTGGVSSVQRMTVTAVGSSNILNTQLSVTGLGGSGTNWAAQSLVFTANSAVTELRFTDTSAIPSTGMDMLLDDVRVIPEAARILRVDSAPNNGVPVTTTAPADLVSGALSGEVVNSQFNRYYLLSSSPTVTLAVPAVVGATNFQKWQRNGADFSGNTSLSTSVSLTADTTMTAVYSVNQAPVTLADSYSTDEDVALVVPAASGVLANDIDPSPPVPLTASVVTAPTRGMLGLNPDGGFTYTPNPNSSGPDSFTYRASDGVVQSAITTVSLMVSSVNDLPTVTVNPIEGAPAAEDVGYVSTIAGFATDIESSLLTYSKVSGPAWLSIAPNGVLLGTAVNSNVGINSFVVRASDGNGASIEAVLNIGVNNVNDAPEFASDPIIASNATEQQNYSGSLAGLASDIDLGDSITYEKVSGPSWLVVASDGALSGTPENADVGSNAFVVRAKDASDLIDDAALLITVVNFNDAPTFTVSPMTRADASEDSPYNGTILDSATDMDVGDPLTFSKISGPSWLLVAGNGVLSGTPLNGDVGLNAFVVRVTDGSSVSDEAALNVTVQNVNDIPTFLVDPTILTNATEDVAYSGTLVGAATDVDAGSNLVYSELTGPAWLTLGLDGSLSGTPTNAEVGLNQFTVKVTDGLSAPVQAVLQITVVNANDAPAFTVNPMTLAGATEDSGYAGTIAGSASDVDLGDSLTYSKFSGPSWLHVASDGTLSGTPLNEHVGVNSFVVSVTDSSSAVGQATLNIMVENVNDAPTFAASPTIGSNATEDVAYTATLVGVATDVDTGATLVYSDLIGPTWLTLGSGGSLSGTPENSDVGINVFTVNVSDGIAPPVQGTLHIMVVDVNDAPVFTVDQIIAAATEDVVYTSTLTTMVTDIDAGETLIYEKVSGPSWLTVAPNGEISGTPPNADVGLSEFVVQVTDSGMVSDSAVLNITVANVNDAPTFVADPTIALNATEDLAYTSTVVGTASDVDTGSVITYSDLTGPAWLTMAVDGSLSGTPANSDVGLNVFTVKVSDGIAPPVQGTLHITVVNVNDAPEFTVDPIIVAATEDVAYTSSLATLVTDIDAGETLIYTKVSGPSWLTVAQNGGLSGTPLNGDVGPNEFMVQVTDSGMISDTSVLNITVANVNDAPAFVANPTIQLNATEGLAYTSTVVGAAIDVDTGAVITYSDLMGPVWLTMGIDGSLSGTPGNANVGLNVFTVKVSDGIAPPVQGTLHVTVINTNDAPEFLVDPIVLTAIEDEAYVGTLANLVSDIDVGDTLIYSKVNGPDWLTVAANGALSGTPINSDVGTRSFSVQVSDGSLSDVTVLEITVTNTNDAPSFLANPTAGTDATEDSPYSGTIAGAATDIDVGDSLTYSKFSGPSWLQVATDGSLSGTPLNENVGSNVFTISVTDGSLPAVEATLNVTVVNVNDMPTFTVNPMAGSEATEDAVYTATLAGSATDVDAGDSLTYAKVGGPSWLTVAENGSLSGSPLNENVGANAFTICVTDGIAPAVQATLNITVVNVNDAPTFTANPIVGSNATEDAVYSATLAGPATDVDAGASLTYARVSGPLWLSVASNGTLSGTPLNENVGANVFTISVTDGIAPAVQATLNITVVNVNDAPTFTANPIVGANATEDLGYSATLAGSGADIDVGDSLSYSKVSGPSWLVVSNSGALSGIPLNEDVGINSFVVRVTDGSNATAIATLTVTVINLNDVPVANPQAIVVNEDSPVIITLTASDVDSPGPLSLTSISLPANGFLSGSFPNIIYTPKPSYSGPDSFTFTINDGLGNSLPATISITVLPVVDDNFANWLSGFGIAGNPGEDPDRDSINNAVEFVIGGNPQNRVDTNLLPTLSLVRADPDQNSSQVDYLLFTYRRTALAKADEKTSIQVQWNPLLSGNWTNAIGTPGVVVVETIDGAALGVDLVNVYIPRSLSLNGKLFARLSVFIDVPSVNTPPVAQAQTISVNENSSRSVVLAATDANGQPLTYRIVTQPTKGLLSGLAPNMTYTPTPNTSGSDSFTFVANDGIVDSAPATVSITVNPVHQFNQWMSTFSLVAPPNVDSDNDSISNAVEYVIGGNPANQSNSNLLPTISLVTADPDNNSINENYLLFTYRRTDLAKNDPKATIRCEWSANLTGSWANAVGTAGAVIVEDPNAVGANFGIVRVFIPRTHAVNGRLFGRLNVTIASP